MLQGTRRIVTMYHKVCKQNNPTRTGVNPAMAFSYRNRGLSLTAKCVLGKPIFKLGDHNCDIGVFSGVTTICDTQTLNSLSNFTDLSNHIAIYL